VQTVGSPDQPVNDAVRHAEEVGVFGQSARRGTIVSTGAVVVADPFRGGPPTGLASASLC